MTVISFANRIKFESRDKIMLYCGRDGNGYQFIAYIVCGIQGYTKLLNDSKCDVKCKDISEYGKVIYKDYSKMRLR